MLKLIYSGTSDVNILMLKNGKYFIKTTTKQQKLIHNYIQRSVMVNNPQIKKKNYSKITFNFLEFHVIPCYCTYNPQVQLSLN